MTDQEYQSETDNKQQIFDVFEELRKLPNQSESMLTDVYFSDFPGASSRIFRIYRALPLHYTKSATNTSTSCPAAGCSTSTVRKPRLVQALSCGSGAARCTDSHASTSTRSWCCRSTCPGAGRTTSCS